ncbi:MAG: efflux RND transporter periplasmic adaptor subunit [Candidatus Omnitrophica bacterium]|nr:efflux RND transporter periplasmic adaptor subunit [Candidatus Omnitrophota bacterium]
MDNHTDKIKKGAGILLLVLALAAVLVLIPRQASHHEHQDERGAAAEKQSTVWTCSMHPQIRMPKPGRCPICGMDLISVEADSASEATSHELKLTSEAAALAGIQTSLVERKAVDVRVRLTGKVEYDETRIAYITAWAAGRIDRLYIDQTGIPVKKGDHMAYLYSPELLSAQEEYLQAMEGAKNVQESHLDIIRSTSTDTVKNAREKLKLLGVTDAQIEELEKRKVPNDHMTVYSPASGIVIKREVQEGDYVQTGRRIYSIVDLSRVWVKLDAYEKDIIWLRYGQDVRFEAEAYPGEVFHGTISLIDPILDEKTRTVKVRVDVNNEKGLLKPGMFVRALVAAKAGEEGQVIDYALAGKWICPMHPEIVRDEKGDCPICGMELVQPKDLGYTSVDEMEAPLVVPASSVLKTGKRAVVYVQTSQEEPVFEGREIVVGARAGDYYIVKSGLSEGERVVTEGNFKIDSAMQIHAKPSMMNPERESAAGGHSHGH